MPPVLAEQMPAGAIRRDIHAKMRSMHTSDRHRASGIKTCLRAKGRRACSYTPEIPCCCYAEARDKPDHPFSYHGRHDMNRAPFADQGRNFSCTQRPNERYPELVAKTFDQYHAGAPVTLFRDDRRVTDLCVKSLVCIAAAITRSQKTRPIKSCAVGVVRWRCSNVIRIATDVQRADGHVCGNIIGRGAPRSPRQRSRQQ